MSAVLLRVAVAGLGLAGVALAAPAPASAAAHTYAAPPAAAAKPSPPAGPAAARPAPPGPAGRCCHVDLDGPARTATAGGAPVEFDLVVSRTDKGCTPIQRSITVRLDGLDAKHIRLERVVSGQALALHDSSPEAGTVAVVDPLVDSKLACGAVTTRYRLAFLDGSPSGRAELVGTAHAPNGRALASDRAMTVVAGPVRTSAPPPQTTPAQATPPPAPTTGVPAEQTTPPAAGAVARPPLRPAGEDGPLSTTLLTASMVFAFGAMLLLGVLWRLRRASGPPPVQEARTTTLPPGIGAELAMLTEDREATGPTRLAAGSEAAGLAGLVEDREATGPTRLAGDADAAGPTRPAAPL